MKISIEGSPVPATVQGRIAIAVVRNNGKGMMFAEEVCSDDKGPYLQAWAVPGELTHRLQEHQEIIIQILHEQSEYCHPLL